MEAVESVVALSSFKVHYNSIQHIHLHSTKDPRWHCDILFLLLYLIFVKSKTRLRKQEYVMMGGRWKDGSEEISFESSSKREEISYVTFSEILCPIGATRGNGSCSQSKFSPWGWEWSSMHDSAVSLHLAPEAGALTAHHCCALAPTCQWGR